MLSSSWQLNLIKTVFPVESPTNLYPIPLFAFRHRCLIKTASASVLLKCFLTICCIFSIRLRYGRRQLRTTPFAELCIIIGYFRFTYRTFSHITTFLRFISWCAIKCMALCIGTFESAYILSW